MGQENNPPWTLPRPLATFIILATFERRLPDLKAKSDNLPNPNH